MSDLDRIMMMIVQAETTMNIWGSVFLIGWFLLMGAVRKRR